MPMEVVVMLQQLFSGSRLSIDFSMLWTFNEFSFSCHRIQFADAYGMSGQRFKQIVTTIFSFGIEEDHRVYWEWILEWTSGERRRNDFCLVFIISKLSFPFLLKNVMILSKLVFPRNVFEIFSVVPFVKCSIRWRSLLSFFFHWFVVITAQNFYKISSTTFDTFEQ